MRIGIRNINEATAFDQLVRHRLYYEPERILTCVVQVVGHLGSLYMSMGWYDWSHDAKVEVANQAIVGARLIEF